MTIKYSELVNFKLQYYHMFCVSIKVSLSEDERKGLEADFHNADYNKLSELVSGLRTAAGYLSQVHLAYLSQVYT